MIMQRKIEINCPEIFQNTSDSGNQSLFTHEAKNGVPLSLVPYHTSLGF
jgi:hypothetical protein